MGLISWIFGVSKPQHCFIIAGKEEITSSQLGAMYVATVIPSADMMIDVLFSSDKPGLQLPLVRSVLYDPMPARLYFLSMMVACGFIHATEVLGANGLVLQDIMKGVTVELKKLRKPDGLLVNPDDVEQVNLLASSFYDFIKAELLKDVNSTTSKPEFEVSKATQLLLSLIVMRYNDGGTTGELATNKLKIQGYYDPAYADVTKMIDDAPNAVLGALYSMDITCIES